MWNSHNALLFLHARRALKQISPMVTSSYGLLKVYPVFFLSDLPSESQDRDLVETGPLVATSQFNPVKLLLRYTGSLYPSLKLSFELMRGSASRYLRRFDGGACLATICSQISYLRMKLLCHNDSSADSQGVLHIKNKTALTNRLCCASEKQVPTPFGAQMSGTGSCDHFPNFVIADCFERNLV